MDFAISTSGEIITSIGMLDLLKSLKDDFGTTYIFVSHDLAVVKAISDRVAVLYQGRLCEIGPKKNVYNPNC